MKRAGVCIAAIVLLGVCCGCTGPMSQIPGVKEIGKISGLGPADEEQIISVLNDVERAMEVRKTSRIMPFVSKNYHDAAGRDYAGIETYLNKLFETYREIRITRVTPKVEIQGDKAQAMDTFGAFADPKDSRVNPPINLQGQVEVRFEKSNGRWQIVEWGRIL